MEVSLTDEGMLVSMLMQLPGICSLFDFLVYFMVVPHALTMIMMMMIMLMIMLMVMMRWFGCLINILCKNFVNFINSVVCIDCIVINCVVIYDCLLFKR